MYCLEVEKRVLPRDEYNYKNEVVTTFVIEAEDENKAFAEYFRDYVNRFKYVNGTRFVLPNPSDQEKYRIWISDINNYANNGGDMW